MHDTHVVLIGRSLLHFVPFNGHKLIKKATILFIFDNFFYIFNVGLFYFHGDNADALRGVELHYKRRSNLHMALCISLVNHGHSSREL